MKWVSNDESESGHDVALKRALFLRGLPIVNDLHCKRLLVVTEQRSWLSPTGDVLGRQVITALQGIEDSYKITLIAREAQAEKEGTRILRNSSGVLLSGALISLSNIRTIAGLVRASDIVVMPCPGVVGVLVGLISAAVRKPTVALVVGNGAEVSRVLGNGVISRRLMLSALHYASKTVVKRASVVRYVTKSNLQKVYPASPNALTFALTDAEFLPDYVSEYRGERERSPGEPLKVLVVGTLDQPYKGIHDVIAAVAILQASQHPVVLTVVGEGRLRSELENLAERALVAGTWRFPGSQFHTVLEDTFAGHDVLVQGSYTEGLARVLVEAINNGLPVVATDVGGTADVVPSTLLVPAGEPLALARKLQPFIYNPVALKQASLAARATLAAATEGRDTTQNAFLASISAL